jgi:hypothetical protein
MKTKLIQYTVKPEMVGENERLVKEVFKQLKAKNPKGFSYSTNKLEDGRTFVHVVSSEHNDQNPLMELEAFRSFQQNIKERCEVQPTFHDIEHIGAFNSIN